MTTYVRLNQEKTAIDRFGLDLTPEQYADLGEWKQSFLRLWIVDEQPTPSADQVVVNAGVMIGPTEARQTWSLRAKTVDELERDELADELAQVDLLVADIKAQVDITNATFNAMTNAQKLDVVRDDRRLVLRGLRFLLRRARKGFN